ncbi:MAG TPA: MaoC/PaaZ C-terminal domain-containing protein [Acidimicrobiales bacterium]|nr:MaoC/PaaZ C-terminal domain-containing protein [Acidimicrobiales bacterium]
MGLASSKLGTRYGELIEELDAERARAYAAATNDGNDAYRSGKLVPPVFGVVPTWAALGLALSDMVPPEATMRIVHGEQDMHFLRPLVAGMTLATTAEAYSIRPAASASRYTVKLTSTDGSSGDPVLEQYVTMVVRDLPGSEKGGPEKPDHRFPSGARSRPVGIRSIHVDDDQTFRYREASGDEMAIHVDEEVARGVGLPGIIVHGLCTMAMTGQAVIDTVAGGDPSRLLRLAVRFSDFVLPGEDLLTTVYDAGADDTTGRHVYAFEAHSNGRRCITHGRAEVAA